MHETAGARSGETKTKVFISYSRKDMAFADKLEAALRARGFEVLIDRQEIYAFEDWWKRIEALIGRADSVVFVLSPDAVTSAVALKEVACAAALNKRFAPIVCRPVEDGAVPEPLRRLNFVFFDDADRFEGSADRLADALNTDIAWIRLHTDFGEAARRWAAAGRTRPRGLLLRSPVLEEAERWIAAHPRGAPPPTEETRAFVAESRRAATWRRRRTMAITAAAALVMVTGLVAWWQQDWLEQRIYVWTNVNALAAAQENALKPGDSFGECTNCPQMVVVPAGSFLMGFPAGQGTPDEHPQHNVTIAKPFAVSKYELTFAEWDTCVSNHGCSGYSPYDDGWGRGERPVINVNWDDARAYVAWLVKVTGKPYRLLSEAEYEYATRAGSTTVFPWGNDIGKNNANCDACGSKWNYKTAPVGSFPPNKFGLYDMVGNVRSWTEDCGHGNYDGAPKDGSAWIAGGDCSLRIIRGGGYNDTPAVLASGFRLGTMPIARDDAWGFRVARTLLAP